MKFVPKQLPKRMRKDSPLRIAAAFELTLEYANAFHKMAKSSNLRSNPLVKQMVEHCIREYIDERMKK